MRSKGRFRLLVAVLFGVQVCLGIAAPAFAGTTGIISGTVKTSSGTALPGAEITVEGTNLHATTDADGYFAMPNVAPGAYKVKATAAGYKDARIDDASVIMDVTESLDFSMEAAEIQETEIVVTDTKAKPNIQRDVVPTMYAIEARQESMIRSQPNVMYQLPSLLLTLPGIVADADGYPHIRGGRNNELGYMLDGIPVTEPITNGFATNMVTAGLDKMEVYTGGYRAEYGNAISGVVNQLTKTGATAPGGRLQVLSGADSFSGLYPEYGGSNGKGFDYYAGGYTWKSDLTGLPQNHVDSSDSIGKFNYSISDKNKMTLLLATGAAKYGFPTDHTEIYVPGQTVTSAGRDDMKQTYGLSTLTFSHTITPRSFVTFRPYFFTNTLKAEVMGEKQDTRYAMDTASDATGLLVDYTNQVSSKHLVKAGISRISSNNRYWFAMPDYGYEYTSPVDTTQMGIYLQDQMVLNAKLRMDLGLRYDRMRYDEKLHPDSTESQVGPRIGFSYAVSGKDNVRASYGKMIQFAESHSIEQSFTDPYWEKFHVDLQPERCTQYDIGWERMLNADLTVQMTPFLREYSDLIQTTHTIPADPESPQMYKNMGHATSRGIEVLLKKRAAKNWSGWLAYTYMKARGVASDIGSTDGTYKFLDWDQRHTLSAVLNYLRKGWTYSLAASYGSGLPYSLADDPVANKRTMPGHTIVDLNFAHGIKGNLLPEGTIQLTVANVFNVRKPLRLNDDGTVYSRIPDRTLGLAYGRRF